MSVHLRLIKLFLSVFPGTPRQKSNCLSSTRKAKTHRVSIWIETLSLFCPSFNEKPCDTRSSRVLNTPGQDGPCQTLNSPLSLQEEPDSLCPESWCHGMPLRGNNTISTVYLISNEGKTLLMQLDQGSARGVFIWVRVAFSGWGLIIISRLQFPTNKG